MSPREKLTRSRSERMLGGVCGGVARNLDVDVTLMRLIWVLVTLMAGGLGLVAYLVLWLVVPDEPGPVSSTNSPSPEPRALPAADGDSDVDSTASSNPDPEEGQEDPEAPHLAAESERSGRGPRFQGGRALGWILVGLGAFFLLQQLVPAFYWQKLWPLALIALGLVVLGTGGRQR